MNFNAPKANEIYKNKLMILRQRIPIGLRDGLILIESVNGDLEKAEKQFKAEMVTLAINKIRRWKVYRYKDKRWDISVPTAGKCLWWKKNTKK